MVKQNISALVPSTGDLILLADPAIDKSKTQAPGEQANPLSLHEIHGDSSSGSKRWIYTGSCRPSQLWEIRPTNFLRGTGAGLAT